jgi:hypothetical protein
MKNFKKSFLLILATLGLAFGIFMIFYSSRKTISAEIPFAPPISPYLHCVAGIGSIEASSDNIEIGIPFPELVMKIYAKSASHLE